MLDAPLLPVRQRPLSNQARRVGEPRIATLLAVVAEAYDLSAEDLLNNRSRATHDLAHARFFVVWLARRLTSHSYLAIARRLGYGDHTSCCYAKKKVDRWIAADPTLADRLEMLAQQCLKHDDPLGARLP